MTDYQRDMKKNRLLTWSAKLFKIILFVVFLVLGLLWVSASEYEIELSSAQTSPSDTAQTNAGQDEVPQEDSAEEAAHASSYNGPSFALDVVRWAKGTVIVRGVEYVVSLSNTRTEATEDVDGKPTGYALVVAGPIAIILIYLALAGMVTWWEGWDKETQEELGDSMYYLGFLYTLTALVMAFSAFQTVASPSAGESDVSIMQTIRKSGFALTSTIWGLTLRILVNYLPASEPGAEKEGETNDETTGDLTPDEEKPGWTRQFYDWLLQLF